MHMLEYSRCKFALFSLLGIILVIVYHDSFKLRKAKGNKKVKNTFLDLL